MHIDCIERFAFPGNFNKITAEDINADFLADMNFGFFIDIVSDRIPASLSGGDKTMSLSGTDIQNVAFVWSVSFDE